MTSRERESDITVTGLIVGQTDKAVFFLWDKRPVTDAARTISLPKSLIAVVHDTFSDKITMPQWLAEDRGLI